MIYIKTREASRLNPFLFSTRAPPSSAWLIRFVSNKNFVYVYNHVHDSDSNHQSYATPSPTTALFSPRDLRAPNRGGSFFSGHPPNFSDSRTSQLPYRRDDHVVQPA